MDRGFHSDEHQLKHTYLSREEGMLGSPEETRGQPPPELLHEDGFHWGRCCDFETRTTMPVAVIEHAMLMLEDLIKDGSILGVGLSTDAQCVHKFKEPPDFFRGIMLDEPTGAGDRAHCMEQQQDVFATLSVPRTNRPPKLSLFTVLDVISEINEQLQEQNEQLQQHNDWLREELSIATPNPSVTEPISCL